LGFGTLFFPPIENYLVYNLIYSFDDIKHVSFLWSGIPANAHVDVSTYVKASIMHRLRFDNRYIRLPNVMIGNGGKGDHFGAGTCLFVEVELNCVVDDYYI
jgi:hypothetical protein